MNKIHILNMLHEVFLRLRNTSHFVFIFVLVIIIIAQSNIAFGESLVPHVETKLSVSYDGQKKSFVATQNTVEGALAQGGIVLAEQDITTPPRTSNLTGADVSISVTRALPVLIVDNGKETLAFSAFTEPKEVLEQLKITTYAEDKVSSDLILDPVDDNAVGQKVIIERAPVYTVEVDGEEKIIRSWGKTVEEILKDKIPLGPKDIVEPLLNSGIIGDVKIVITRINEIEVEEVAEVMPAIIYKDDFFIPSGTEVVLAPGKIGEKKNLVKIVYKNGIVYSREILNSEVTAQAEDKVVKRGLMPSSHKDFKLNYWKIMVDAGQKYGISPLALFKVAACESHVNPTPTPGQYYGMFQYSDGFWQSAFAAAGFSGSDWSDGTAQIYATAKYASQNGWGRWGCKP